ncbi:MAG: elongation factor P [Acidobacteriota bacterium]|jgi:elongation factor P|nr:elongation factor P [Acidobacteriota bacterium]
MALIGANELKRKMLIKIDNQPYAVLDVFFASPSARGASTMVRTKIRNLITDAVMEKTFRTSEKFEEPDVVLTPASYLYSDGENYHFMDEGSYEQFSLPETQLGEEKLYLKDGLSLQMLKYNGAPIAIQLPQFVELAVASTEPGGRNDTGTGGSTKPATLETGLQVRVPLFIKEGEIVRVNTQTGEFASRA